MLTRLPVWLPGAQMAGANAKHAESALPREKFPHQATECGGSSVSRAFAWPVHPLMTAGVAVHTRRRHPGGGAGGERVAECAWGRERVPTAVLCPDHEDAHRPVSE